MDIFTKFPQAAIRILQVLSKDLRLAEEKWTDQMDKDASQRIAEALIFLQEHFTHQNWTIFLQLIASLSKGLVRYESLLVGIS